MKKHYLQILVIGMVGALIFGCTAQKLQQSQTSFTPRQFPAEHYAHKVDNFIVVLDASSSMGEWYNGQTKFNLARNIVDRMNQTIPDLKMNGALRTFGHSPKLSREKTVPFAPNTKRNAADGTCITTPSRRWKKPSQKRILLR